MTRTIHMLAWALLAACTSSTVVYEAPDAENPDGSTDAPVDVGSGDGSQPDASAGDGRTTGPPPLAWSVEQVRVEYCVPLAEARCAAQRACDCYPFPARCLLEDEIATCFARFEQADSSTEVSFFFDGLRLADLLATQEALLGACRSPSATWVRLTENLSTIVDVSLGESCPDEGPEPRACAGGLGVCISGTCAALQVEGDFCGGRSPCRFPARCSGGVCRVPGPVGTSCAGDLECVAPARCSERTCANPGDQGAPCDVPADCRAGLDCVGGTCAELDGCALDACEGADCFGRGTCEVPPSAGAPCPDGACSPDAYCSSGTCVARGAVGDPCDATLFGRDCLLGYCGPGDQCADPLPLGAPCDFDAQCGPRERMCALDAGSSMQTCQALPGEGEPCPGNFCAEPLACQDGTCRDLTGASCSDQTDLCGSSLRCAVTEYLCGCRI